ncbi:MAG: hypothetical protein O2983_09165 [Planctomycetota bacterium]|nr:hypothetical protein [Planctomycetota bacterium]MDA0917964.1 hypothetical protein [Planctomycetota bacterium]MDA1159765.1 hypothetical protein [Planctomycetota bacterium]
MFDSRTRRLTIALLAIFCASCVDDNDLDQSVSSGSNSFTTPNDSASSNVTEQIVLQVVDKFPASAPSNPFSIESAKVVGDTLQLELSYGGGCKDHVFTAFWAPIFLEEEPPSTEILITHDARNDSCEAWISQKLTIDLMPLRKTFLSVDSLDEAFPIDALELSITLITEEQNIVNIRYSLDQHSSGESGRIQGQPESFENQ